MWFRNGVPDLTRGNLSTITVTDYNDGDVFTCRADNIVGFDEENTTIHMCKSVFYICDWVCKNQPSSRTKIA